ncbi:hypothetical protein SNEBB_003156 [Seison nebaliae]|nr:hypothetical protein SNEBB_003156 [Seison nebaliae]
MSEKENFLRKFKSVSGDGLRQLTATEFLEVWEHFDKDNNGYIENDELDEFLIQLATSKQSSFNPNAIPRVAMEDMKECFLAAYDENDDGKIEISELAELLPTEENFLLLFRKSNPLESSGEFMKIWRMFDDDCSGSIDKSELNGFIRSLISQTKKKSSTIKKTTSLDIDEEKIEEYAVSILRIFDTNNDGKLELCEMTKLLPVKNNFLHNIDDIGYSGLIDDDDIDEIFDKYDDDRNGFIEEYELDGFVRDMFHYTRSKSNEENGDVNEDECQEQLEEFKHCLLTGSDVDNDGKLSKAEIKMILHAMQQSLNSRNES